MSTERPVDKAVIDTAVKALKQGSLSWLIPEANYGGAEYSATPFQHKDAAGELARTQVESRRDYMVDEMQRLLAQGNIPPTDRIRLSAALASLQAARSSTEIERAIASAELAINSSESSHDTAELTHQQKMAMLLGEMHKAATDINHELHKFRHIHLRNGSVLVSEKEAEELDKLARACPENPETLEDYKKIQKWRAYQDGLAKKIEAHKDEIAPEDRAAYEESMSKIKNEQDKCNDLEKKVENSKKSALLREKKESQRTLEAEWSAPIEARNQSSISAPDVSFNDVSVPSLKHQPKSTGQQRS